ncbi:MAG: SiaB family protein kinase [bacterium]|nr:SiaB family protein kinase [bacterium]
MAISDVYDFYKRMEDEHIILSFKGAFTEDLLTSILHIVEGKMEALDIDTKKKKRVFNVLVESFQNLYHHIEEMAPEEGEYERNRSAMIIVKYEEKRFTIITGNFVNSNRIPELRQKLETVNALNDEALRELYRSKLENGGRTEKGTAGLGLIDIARKSKNKLDYEIINVTEATGFFCLSVLID